MKLNTLGYKLFCSILDIIFFASIKVFKSFLDIKIPSWSLINSETGILYKNDKFFANFNFREILLFSILE